MQYVLDFVVSFGNVPGRSLLAPLWREGNGDGRNGPALIVREEIERYHPVQGDSCPQDGERGTESHQKKVRDGGGVSQNATTQE